MKIATFAAAFVVALFVSGCATTAADWRKPDGFHGGEKEFVILQFSPQISIGLGENIAESMYLEKYIATKLAGSGRFNVLASGYKGEFSKDTSVVLELTPTVRLVSSFNGQFRIITSIDCKNIDLQSGVYSGVGTFNVRGISGGTAHAYGLSGQYEESYRLALAQLIRELNKRYPVTGRISDMAVYGRKTVFQFMRGTVDGVESSDDILIYAVDKNRRISATVAIAKAEVSLNSSRITVAKWNFEDDEVKYDLMPGIMNRDKSLKLYAVCRKVKQ